MRVRVVDNKDISPRSLLAEDYVFSARAEAIKLVRAWLKDNPGWLTASSPVAKDLAHRIEAKLNEALERRTK